MFGLNEIERLSPIFRQHTQQKKFLDNEADCRQNFYK
jgi:hypothetical protein